jgi:hypothetical protein
VTLSAGTYDGVAWVLEASDLKGLEISADKVKDTDPFSIVQLMGPVSPFAVNMAALFVADATFDCDAGGPVARLLIEDSSNFSSVGKRRFASGNVHFGSSIDNKKTKQELGARTYI